MKIKSIARFIKYQLYWKKHPVEYAKMIGVNILGGVKIYGKVFKYPSGLGQYYGLDER